MKMSAGSIGFWVKDKGYDGIGVLGKSTPAVDIDVHSRELSEKLVEFITKRHPTCLKRVGQAPKVLIPFKTDKPLKKRYIGFTDAQGVEHKVEILADGQQWAAFGVHPGTGLPYQWLDDGNSILNVPHDDLPVLTEAFIDELFEYVKSILPEGAKLGISVSESRKRGGLENVSSTVDMSVDKIKELLEPINADDYDVYLKVGQALHHQFEGSDEGLAIWHEWASESNKYKADELDYKWRGFSEVPLGGKPVTMRSVITLNALSQEQATMGKIEKMLQRYVYVANKEEVVDLECVGYKNVKSLKAFKSEQRNSPILRIDNKGTLKEKVVRLNPADVWMEHPERITAVDYGYLPGEDRLYNDVDGMLMMNQFRFPDHNKDASRANNHIFYEHVNYIFGEPQGANYFLDFLAQIIQEPGKRRPRAIVHIGSKGTGRSKLGDIVKSLLGRWNCSEANAKTYDPDSSKSSYNDHLHQTLFCQIDESKSLGAGRYQASEAIKSDITEGHRLLNIKGAKQVSCEIFTRFFVASNHTDPVCIDEDERRFNIFRSYAKKREHEYYVKLHAWADDPENIAGLFWELMERDINKYDYHNVIKNQAWYDLVSTSQSDIEVLFDGFLEKPTADYMTFNQVKDVLTDLSAGEVIVEDRQLLRLLRNKAHAGKKVKFNGVMIRPWCFTNGVSDDGDYIRNCLSKVNRLLGKKDNVVKF